MNKNKLFRIRDFVLPIVKISKANQNNLDLVSLLVLRSKSISYNRFSLELTKQSFVSHIKNLFIQLLTNRTFVRQFINDRQTSTNLIQIFARRGEQSEALLRLCRTNQRFVKDLYGKALTQLRFVCPSKIEDFKGQRFARRVLWGFSPLQSFFLGQSLNSNTTLFVKRVVFLFKKICKRGRYWGIFSNTRKLDRFHTSTSTLGLGFGIWGEAPQKPYKSPTSSTAKLRFARRFVKNNCSNVVPNIFWYFTYYKTSYTIVRPLVGCLRCTVTMTCVLSSLPVYPDLSNLKLQYSRNRLRKQIIPAIRFFFNPKVEKAILQFSELSAKTSFY